jgi:hypothetical protein
MGGDIQQPELENLEQADGACTDDQCRGLDGQGGWCSAGCHPD